MIFDWFRQRAARRAANRALIALDARALIEEHGERALAQANCLMIKEDFDGPQGDRPLGHWSEVRDAVRRLAKKPVTTNRSERRMRRER